MPNPNARVSAAIERLWPDYLELLRSLVREPSTLGDERGAQLIAFRHLRRIGLAAELWDLDLEALRSHPDFIASGGSYVGRPNVTAVCPGTGGGRSLVLNSHVDVVSVEPSDWWTYGPWDATVAGDRLYGRGVYDMKAGFVASVLALHAVRAALPPLRGTVIVESVIEEECTGNGTLAARVRSGPVDGAIIPEPTDLATWTATPGVIWFEVTVTGNPAYVGQGDRAVNAIQQACDLIVGLRALPDELNRRLDHPAYRAAHNPLTLNVGEIRAGEWPSNVPLVCRFTCRMSFPPDWPPERAQTLIEERIAALAAADPWLAAHRPVVRCPGFRARGWEVAADSPLLRLLDERYHAVSGEALARVPFFGTADGRYFDAGRAEHVVYFGPRGGGIHAPDEYVELDSVLLTARVLAGVIAEWTN